MLFTRMLHLTHTQTILLSINWWAISAYNILNWYSRMQNGVFFTNISNDAFQVCMHMLAIVLVSCTSKVVNCVFPFIKAGMKLGLHHAN